MILKEKYSTSTTSTPSGTTPDQEERNCEPNLILCVPPAVLLKFRSLTRYELSICKSVSIAFQPPPNPRRVMFSSLFCLPTFKACGNTETVICMTHTPACQ